MRRRGLCSDAESTVGVCGRGRRYLRAVVAVVVRFSVAEDEEEDKVRAAWPLGGTLIHHRSPRWRTRGGESSILHMGPRRARGIRGGTYLAARLCSPMAAHHALPHVAARFCPQLGMFVEFALASASPSSSGNHLPPISALPLRRSHRNSVFLVFFRPRRHQAQICRTSH